MQSQWDCLRQNLGEWKGSFAQLGPAGDVWSDTPSVLTLEDLPDRGTIRLILRRWPEGQAPSEVQLEFGPPGPAPETLFFPSGAFSQGLAQWVPGRSFACELGFTAAERRLRLVPMFAGGCFDLITVIREQRAGSTAPERPALKATDLVDTWQGEATRLFPDLARSPEIFPTTLQIRSEGADLLEFGPDPMLPASDRPQPASITETGLCLEAAGRNVMLLPDGGFLGYPQKLQFGQAFAIEVGWHLGGDRRERLIRRYGERGEWLDLTWVREQRAPNR